MNLADIYATAQLWLNAAICIGIIAFATLSWLILVPVVVLFMALSRVCGRRKIELQYDLK